MSYCKPLINIGEGVIYGSICAGLPHQTYHKKGGALYGIRIRYRWTTTYANFKAQKSKKAVEQSSC